MMYLIIVNISVSCRNSPSLLDSFPKIRTGRKTISARNKKILHTENKMIFVTEFEKSPFYKNSMIFPFRATEFLI